MDKGGFYIDNSAMTNIPDIIMSTINTIFEKLFSSIDSSLYVILDKITFIDETILNDSYFNSIFGGSTSEGLLLISNALLFGILLYYCIKYILHFFTFSSIEAPTQFIFKLVIYGICMNYSFFLVEEFLMIISNISLAIQEMGQTLFGCKVNFAELINKINMNIYPELETVNFFSLDGLIKGLFSSSLLGLVFSYSFRYIMVKIFILLTPFAFLCLCTHSTSWFFKAWIRNLFSLMFIQIIVAIVLLLIFSLDFTSVSLFNKFICIGSIYALIKANDFVREIVGGLSTGFSPTVDNLWKTFKQ